MVGSKMGAALVAMAVMTGGCAVAPATGGEGESTGASASEMSIIRKVPVSLQLTATLHRVATASGTWGIKEVQYLSFHVVNVGTTAAAASQLAISCTLAQPALNFSADCTTPIVMGLPAIGAGGFYDYSWPSHGVDIGSGNDSNLWVPSGMSLAETITARLQSSTQIVDPTLGTVVLNDTCADNASCAAIPTVPSPLPGGAGLLGTKLQYGYFYGSVTPTSLSMFGSGPDGYPLGTTPVHGGETVNMDFALMSPSGAWSYAGINEPLRVYVDNQLVTTVTATGQGYVAASFALPAYDGSEHTIQATFAGDGALAPTVSHVMSFTLVP